MALRLAWLLCRGGLRGGLEPYELDTLHLVTIDSALVCNCPYEPYVRGVPIDVADTQVAIFVLVHSAFVVRGSFYADAASEMTCRNDYFTGLGK